MPSPPAFGRRGDPRRGWQSSPRLSSVGRDASGSYRSSSEGIRSGLRRRGSRSTSTYRPREGSPFSRGEKVRMRLFQQSAKNWTVTEMGTRELGVRSVPALQ